MEQEDRVETQGPTSLLPCTAWNEDCSFIFVSRGILVALMFIRSIVMVIELFDPCWSYNLALSRWNESQKCLRSNVKGRTSRSSVLFEGCEFMS